jgi:hypothetical protein
MWGELLKAIGLFCTTVALAGMLAVAPVQAQEPANWQARSLAGTAAPALDVVLETNRPPLGDISQTAVAQTHFAQTDNAQVVVAPPWVQEDLPQDPGSQKQDPPSTSATADGKSSPSDAPKPQSGTSTPGNPDEDYGKQEKRILWIVPNFRAVSANTHLPPMSFKSKLWLASQDSFDYSNFIFVGALSGIDMASRSQPSFEQGAEGYGKYYWHVFADTGIENYMAEAIVPEVTKEDPRYYTLGKGGFPKRAIYSLGRLFITRTDSGHSTFNLSEIVGAGGAAGISNFYYPAESNPWVKTYQRWGTQVTFDGMFNMVKEFWPDINRAVFRGHY